MICLGGRQCQYFKNICLLVLWTKVALALEGLRYRFFKEILMKILKVTAGVQLDTRPIANGFKKLC